MANSKPTLNLVSHAATSSSTEQSPIASKSPGILRAPCQPDWKSTGRLVAREHNQDAASSCQVWQKDAEKDESTRRLAPAEKDQELLNFHENLKSSRETRRIRKLRHQRCWHNMATQSLQKSTAYVPHLEKVFSNVRERYGLKPGDKKCSSLVNVYVRHSSICSSSWERIFREVTFHQESAQTIIETVVPCN